MIHYSLLYLQSEGHRIYAHCEAQPPRGENPCRHSQALDWDKLIEAFGPDFVIPRQRDYFLSRLRCSKCGSGHVGIIMNAPGGYGG